jgi:hypothetical protein
MEATRPRRITSLLISLMLKRERGRPSSLGSSQARAFTATTMPGGKDTRPPLPGEFLQAGHSLLEEALAPLAACNGGTAPAFHEMAADWSRERPG